MFRTTSALFFIILSVGSYAAEQLTIDFTFDRNVNIGSIRPALKLEEFTDGRGLADSFILTGDYSVNTALPEIVRDAFAQGFAKGGVTLVDSGDDMQIAGNVISSESQIVDRGGVQSIQLTIRTNIQLRGGGRTIWESTLFGRGVVPESEGMAAAVNAALDRSVRELFNDDYFLIELQ